MPNYCAPREPNRESLSETVGLTRIVNYVRHVILDSNAIDPIADLPGAYEAVRQAVDARAVELLYTHININIDELAAIPNLERRSRLILVLVDLGRLVATGAFALDFSRLDFARLDDSDDQSWEALKSRGMRHTRDALIAITAEYENCALVTNERRLANRARDRSIEVITTAELLAELGFHSPQLGFA